MLVLLPRKQGQNERLYRPERRSCLSSPWREQESSNQFPAALSCCCLCNLFGSPCFAQELLRWIFGLIFVSYCLVSNHEPWINALGCRVPPILRCPQRCAAKSCPHLSLLSYPLLTVLSEFTTRDSRNTDRTGGDIHYFYYTPSPTDSIILFPDCSGSALPLDNGG